MPKDDVWIHTACEFCLAACGMVAHRVNGVVVELKGDPDCPNSRGKLCARGHGAIMSLYDPHRLKTPMKRTNPEKGLGIDPGWVPITWEEALQTLTEKLTKVRKEDPRKLVISTFDTSSTGAVEGPWSQAFGTPNRSWHGYFCGNHLHAAIYMTDGSYHCEFDTEYCNYVMLFGHQMGFGAGINTVNMAQKVAAARKRGMKVVSIDPVGNNAAAKADEWVPIRPGTDAAFVLSMINVLVNELGMYDRAFIKKYTNGPYLVKPDGYYMRQNGKPLVWDAAEGKAKPYDAEVKDYAIEGSYTVEGVDCKPAFQLLKERAKKYTPEMAAEITTIPAANIRRIAQEFGTAARIGSTITIDGIQFPYRPVAATVRRGAGAHKHGLSATLAVQLLDMIVGALYVPGAHHGNSTVGPDWAWQPEQVDGIVLPHKSIGREADYYEFHDRKVPQSMDLKELFPLTTNRAGATFKVALDPEKYGLPYKPEVLIVGRRNLFMGGCDYNLTAQALLKFKFIAFFGNYLDETSDFGDIALPEAIFLEKLQLYPNQLTGSNSNQTGYWHWGIRQPVVPPVGEVRDWADVLMELADRMGFLPDVYKAFNKVQSEYALTEPYKLDPSQKYTKEEIADRRLKSKFGEDKGLAWFKEHGYFSFKRKLDEQHPLPWLKVRFPIYFENFLSAGESVRQIATSMGLKDWDTADYDPLPEWKPCEAYKPAGDYDLIASNFRVPTNSQSYTAENPWLCEVAELNPYAQKILINTQTARKKGIKDDDRIWVESVAGKVVGEAKVTECVHPEVIGISSHFGSYSKGKPIAYGKGANFNKLLRFDIDPVSAGVDACVRVKVYKVT